MTKYYIIPAEDVHKFQLSFENFTIEPVATIYNTYIISSKAINQNWIPQSVKDDLYSNYSYYSQLDPHIFISTYFDLSDYEKAQVTEYLISGTEPIDRWLLNPIKVGLNWIYSMI